MRSSRISLSRLAITGAVTICTPLVVLKEIAEAHSIVFNETKTNESRYLIHLINTINTKNVKIVQEPYNMRDYKLIARFINKNFQWKKGVLKRALDFLLKYTDWRILSEPHVEFKYGLQTPDDPESLNACVLYGICKTHKIATRLDSSIDEMAANIKMFFSLKDPNLCHTVRKIIHEAMIYNTVENHQLVNLLSVINPTKSIDIIKTHHRVEEEDIPTISYNDLDQAGNEIRQRNIRIQPDNHIEAVAMAAIYYKMDISEAENPLAEYQELQYTPFFPISRKLTKRLQKSNLHSDHIQNLKLDKVFNPNLPQNLYEDDDLISMCLEEGYTNNEIRMEGAYTLLQTAYLLPTFLHGKQTEITNEETTMLDSIENIEYDRIVLYGIRSQAMRAYTYGELTDCFKYYRRFQMPDGNNGTYEDNAINKLYTLCHRDQKPTETEEIFQERLELGEEIDRIRLYLQTNQEQVRQFVERYEDFNEHQKLEVRNFMELLMKCAMYMRGWSGQGPYPLSAYETNVDYNEQPNIELNVTQSIQEIDSMLINMNSIDAAGDFGNLVKELPLIFYHHQSNELLPSTDSEEGLTIYERINIVKGGENGSIQSCIRMSSNRFAASAYYYMRLLSMRLPFNIADLDHIQ